MDGSPLNMCRGQFGILVICSFWACSPLVLAQGLEEPEAILTGGFVQQLRALPADAVETYQFTDSDSDSGGTRQYSSVAQAQAQARANAYKPNAGYPLPAQPTGRSTLQRTHESPWLERLTQDNQTRAAEPRRSPSDTSTPMYRSVQGRRIAPQPVEEVPEQEASQRQPLPFESTPPMTRQGFSLATPPENTLTDLPDGRLQSTSEAMSEKPTADFTASSLQQAPRVSRVPLPRPAKKQVVNTVKKDVESNEPSRLESTATDLQLNASPVGEQSEAAPKRIPAISTSVAPLPGAIRISNATLKSSSTPSKGESVRVPAQLTDATRTEQQSTSNQQGSSQDVSEPTAKDVTGVAPIAKRSLADDPTALELDLPALPTLPPSSTSNTASESIKLPSRSSMADVDDITPPMPSLPEMNQKSPPAVPTIVRADQANDGATSKTDTVTPNTEKLPPVPAPTTERKPASVAKAQTSTVDRSAAPSLAMPKLTTDSQRSRAVRDRVPSPDERVRMEAPHIQVLLNGPADLPIGIPARYEVVVRNEDAIDLNGLILRLDIPAGVQVQPMRPSHGQFEVEQAADGLTMLTWGFEHLAAGKTATAPMQLVASSAKNFSVAMEWTLTPIAGASNVSVSAPRLEIALEGPAEVLYTEPNVYRVHVRNPGNAAANNVTVRLNAEPHGSSTAEVAHVAPGEEEVIEVELTFNKRGNIQITAQAQEPSGLSSETAINVLVRQPLVQSQLIATESIYHGSAAECRVLLSNSGDADATNLQASMRMPRGASLISAPSGAKLAGSELTWPVGRLVAGSSEEFLVHLSLTHEGANQFQFTCANSSGLKTTAKATTEVEAISDLKLFVDDPIAPAPVGSEVVYELTLTNRGSKAATNVKVIAQFSEGIEPIRGEGQAVRVVTGQALFEPIARIDAGETKHLKIVAQAAAAGNHRFRAEVRSDEEEVRLVQEESTQYLEGASRIAAPPSKSSLR